MAGSSISSSSSIGSSKAQHRRQRACLGGDGGDGGGGVGTQRHAGFDVGLHARPAAAVAAGHHQHTWHLQEGRGKPGREGGSGNKGRQTGTNAQQQTTPPPTTHLPQRHRRRGRAVVQAGGASGQTALELGVEQEGGDFQPCMGGRVGRKGRSTGQTVHLEARRERRATVWRAAMAPAAGS